MRAGQAGGGGNRAAKNKWSSHTACGNAEPFERVCEFVYGYACIWIMCWRGNLVCSMTFVCVCY